jgi:hypothetical protein
MGLVVDARSTDVCTRGALNRALFLCVAVEADDRAQPASNGRPGLAGVLEIAGKALDVDPTDIEHMPATLQTPRGEMAQIAWASRV